MIVKLYIVEYGEKYYLCNWFVDNGMDNLVFTAFGRHAMRFVSKEVAKDYIYQLRAYGYEPKMEVM